MKKILLLLLVAVLGLSIFACGQTGESTSESQSQSQSQSQSSGEQTTTYTVTFVQAGQDDVVITVNEGEGVAEADIPALVHVDGHDVAWDVTDLSEITENLTVTAVATPKNYTITYVVECNCGELSAPDAKTVTFGTAYTLDAPVGACACEFLYWALADGTEFTNGTYTTVGSVTVYAVFSNVTHNPY